MRFILYARASTKDKQHPEHQIAELRTEAARRGWSIVDEVTEKESGRKDDRPMWVAALDRVLLGEADGIASVELSRWGRSTQHLLQVSAALRAAGRHLVCTRQPIDTTTPAGRLLFTMLAAVAEFEADLTRERVRAGVAAAKTRRGGTWGRTREHLDAVALRLAEQGLDNGLSWRQLSAALAAAGYVQPARAEGKSKHPARPWPTGTLRDALARVGLPRQPQTQNSPDSRGRDPG
jgi:putative DNA-invertase from lambdoid prophage Rac